MEADSDVRYYCAWNGLFTLFIVR